MTYRYLFNFWRIWRIWHVNVSKENEKQMILSRWPIEFFFIGTGQIFKLLLYTVIRCETVDNVQIIPKGLLVFGTSQTWTNFTLGAESRQIIRVQK